MVCEAFSCAVPVLLDELVTESSLRALFSLVLPTLRPDMQAGRRGQPAPYVLGYWAKVVALLCKRRPAALVRFLSLQVRWCMWGQRAGAPSMMWALRSLCRCCPQQGVAAALASHLHNGSVATLLCASLLRLPFSGALRSEQGGRVSAVLICNPPRTPSLSAARFGGMARLFLCSADPAPLPELLLGVMRRALEAAAAPASPGAAPPAADHSAAAGTLGEGS